MKKFKLTFDTEQGSGDIDLDGGKISFGRGSEADYRFPDDGLSRLHATVYNEDDRIWVVDENSSNGTLVNGIPVSGAGQPLSEGDVIRIGHHTNLRVAAIESGVNAAPAAKSNVVSAAENGPSMVVPLAVIGVAFLLIVSSLAVIGISMYGGSETDVASTNERDGDLDFDTDSPEESDSPGPGNTQVNDQITPSVTTRPDETPSEIETGLPTGQPPPVLPRKQYRNMTPAEQSLFIKVKAEKVARLIGNKSSGDIPPDALASIKRYVDQYARRFRSNRLDDCRSRNTFTRSDMQTVLERASKNVPFITRSFRTQAVDPQVGIYVAMIESEHCVCLQSGTGPLGMFQFTYSTGKAYGLNVQRNASPTNPDQRCEPQPASLASAKYLRYLSGRIGTGPLSVPLAIASYNSGEGGLGQNLMKALTSNSSEERSFWTLVANAEQLSKQFQSENIKYVPKFFGAAIIGENPTDFGAPLQPLSTYSR